MDQYADKLSDGVKALLQRYKGMRFPLEVILVCIRWYVAYPLSYRQQLDLEQQLTQIGALLKLTWTYESPSGGAPEQEASGPLLAPPAQEMAALHHLARLGNMHDIGQWASELAGRDERYRPFANQLCQLAKGYQSKAILNLVKQYLEKSD